MTERKEKGKIVDFSGQENLERERCSSVVIEVAGIQRKVATDPYNFIFVGLPLRYKEVLSAQENKSVVPQMTEKDSALVHFFNLTDFKYADWRLDYRAKDCLWQLRRPNRRAELRISTGELKKFTRVGVDQYFFDLLRLQKSYKQPIQDDPVIFIEFVQLYRELKETQSDSEAVPVVEKIKSLLLKNRLPEPKYAFGQILLARKVEPAGAGVVRLSLV